MITLSIDYHINKVTIMMIPNFTGLSFDPFLRDPSMPFETVQDL